jgi:cation:H+ antiporter
MMYVEIALGFVLLLGGAEFLVRGAVDLAERWGVSHLVIGMTVVAFGTSAPEFVTTLNAALAGASAMALGNVVGSNIANIFLIMGAAGLLAPLAIQPRAFLFDGSVLLLGSFLFAALCAGGIIDLWPSLLLLAAFAAFLGATYWRETRGKDKEAAAIHEKEVDAFEGLSDSLGKSAAAVALGLIGVVGGAMLLVEGGVSLAREVGISEEVIGLTLIAFGTSLPELAASVVAAWRGHSELALGNVAGSNMFNMLGVAGAVGLISPLPVPAQINTFDIWVMLAGTFLILPAMVAGWRFGRFMGGLFLAIYFAFIAIEAIGVPDILAW